MIRELWIPLIIPLLFFFILCLVLNYYFQMDGFFINLSTSLLEIIITVAYVDWIIRKREFKRWEGVDKRISYYIRVFINATISSVRDSLDYDINIFDYYTLSISSQAGKEYLMDEEVIRISREILEPNIENKIIMWDQDNWKRFIKLMKDIWDEGDRIVSTYSDKLSPNQYEIMLDIREKVRSIFGIYTTFIDFAGVIDENLPKRENSYPIEIKNFVNSHTSKLIREMLEKVRELDKIITQKAS